MSHSNKCILVLREQIIHIEFVILFLAAIIYFSLVDNTSQVAWGRDQTYCKCTPKPYTALLLQGSFTATASSPVWCMAIAYPSTISQKQQQFIQNFNVFNQQINDGSVKSFVSDQSFIQSNSKSSTECSTLVKDPKSIFAQVNVTTDSGFPQCVQYESPPSNPILPPQCFGVTEYGTYHKNLAIFNYSDVHLSGGTSFFGNGMDLRIADKAGQFQLFAKCGPVGAENFGHIGGALGDCFEWMDSLQMTNSCVCSMSIINNAIGIAGIGAAILLPVHIAWGLFAKNRDKTQVE
jgi:hypothetical protein